MERTASERIFWYYNSSAIPWPNTPTSNSTLFEWSKYRDIEMELIEEAFQRGDVHVMLDRYRIDFEPLIQVRLDDETKRRQIKRETTSNQQSCVRKDRFTSSIAITTVDTVPSYGAPDAWCPFLRNWQKTKTGLQACLKLSFCIEACAQGIVKEAALHHGYHITEAAYMAEKLRSCWLRTNSKVEVLKCCVGFYTSNSFLYEALNTALRKCDNSKIETFGPLAYLLHEYSRMDKGFSGIVYRGLNLTTTDLQMYERARRQWQTWSAFTSTSKRRDVAELFQTNTLLVIDISNFQLGVVRGSDITHLSKYPDEEEVLIPAGTNFRVTNIEQDAQQRYIIHIEI